MDRLLLPLALLSLALPAAAQQPAPPLIRSIDVFGTDRIAAADVRERYGEDLEAIVRAGLGEAVPDLRDRYMKVMTALRSMGDFAYLDLAMVQSFDGGAPAVHVTVDVVERADSARRMDFAPAPTDTVLAAEELLEAWDAYMETGMALLRSGALDPVAGESDCPALHCLFGFAHDSLRAFEALFEARVIEERAALIRVLEDDARPERRAAAAFLLAHLDDSARVAAALVPAVRDPSSIVRNNALRVLLKLAMRDPAVPMSLDPFLEALDFPGTTDRNKAGYALVGLAKRPEHHGRILREAGPILLRMLELEQPNNHQPAYEVLRELSGLDLDARDYAAWRAWWRRAVSEEASP